LVENLACGAPTVVSAAAPTGKRIVIADGHVDMGPRITNGTWRLQLRDDTTNPPTWRELDDIVLHGSDKAKITIPNGDTYRFLGASGDPICDFNTALFEQVFRIGEPRPNRSRQLQFVFDSNETAHKT
jgi:hypothetical protein